MWPFNDNKRLEAIECALDVLGAKVDSLLKLGGKVLMTQQEAVTKLNETVAKLTKIGGETSSLLTKIDELKTVIAAGGNASPELEAAVAALTTQADVVDGLVDDLPTPPPA